MTKYGLLISKTAFLKKPIFTPKPTAEVYLGKLGNTQYIVIVKNFKNSKTEVLKLRAGKLRLAGF